MCCFGEIVSAKMQLSDLGAWAKRCWQEIPVHFPFVIPGEYIIMPNHIHGILIIDKPQNVETQNVASKNTSKPQNRFGPQSQNLASIIRGFKIGVTKYAREKDIPFGWQARYWDHIIRDQRDYDKISQYIVNNPARWEEDELYKTL